MSQTDKPSKTVPKVECLDPSVELMNTHDGLLSYMRSHDWFVDGAEPMGSNAVLVKLHCTKCNSFRVMIANSKDK